MTRARHPDLREHAASRRRLAERHSDITQRGGHTELAEAGRRRHCCDSEHRTAEPAWSKEA